jgi:hypothetical protein
MVGVGVSLGVDVAGVVGISEGVDVGKEVEVEGPGMLGIWQARMRRIERVVTNFCLKPIP